MALTKLKIAILEKNLTQKMVAQKAGIHESTLSQITRGTYVPDHRQKQLISRAINEKAEELFSDRSVTSESMR